MVRRLLLASVDASDGPCEMLQSYGIIPTQKIWGWDTSSRLPKLASGEAILDAKIKRRVGSLPLISKQVNVQ